MRVHWVNASFRIDDEEQQVGFGDCLTDLTADLDVHRQV